MENVGYAFTWLKNNAQSGNTTMNMFGKLQLANFEGLGKMEQDVASAASAIETSDNGLTGAPHYRPVFFCGIRVVHGINYAFFAEKTQATNPYLRALVRVECNCFDGKYELVPSSEIELPS